jgi:UDP-glucose 4-epimerase
MATTLITGGSGLIGWCTAEALVGAGHAVVVYDLHPNLENLAGLLDKVTVVDGNVTDLAKLLATMRLHKVSHVIHLAAVTSGQTKPDPASAFRVNTCGTANVFDAALALSVNRVVWTSSVTALSVAADYDNAPVDEEYRVASAGAYGASKYAAEIMAD